MIAKLIAADGAERHIVIDKPLEFVRMPLMLPLRFDDAQTIVTTPINPDTLTRTYERCERVSRDVIVYREVLGQRGRT